MPPDLKIIKAPPASELKYKQKQRKILEGERRNQHFQRISPVKKRIAEAEKEVAALTARQAEIEALFADPEHYKNGEKAAETNREYVVTKERIRKLTAEWDRLTAEAEKIESEYEAEKGRLGE